MTLRITEIPNLFSELSVSMKEQINSFNTAKLIKAKQSRIHHINKSQRDIQNPISSENIKLSFNIVFQFLRNHNLNYTYNMLISEAMFPIKDILYTDQLRTLISIKETDVQNRKYTLQKYTLIDEMLQAIQKFSKEQTECSTQTLEVDNSINLELMFNRKYDVLKEQLSKIYQEQYKHKLKTESYREPSQIRQYKQQLKREFQNEYESRYKAKTKLLDMKEELIKKKQSQFITVYTSKMEQVSNQSKRIKAQSVLLKEQLMDALHKIQTHSCLQDQDYKSQINKVQEEKRKLKQLQNQYKLALSNINTKVEDIIQKKQSILQSNKQYNVDKQKRLKLDDHTSRKLLKSITNLQQRVNILGKQNITHLKDNELKGKKIMQLQGQLRRVQELLVQEQEIVNRTMELRDRSNIIAKKSVAVGANELDIDHQMKPMTSEQQKQEEEELFKLIQESNKNKLQYLNNLDRINLDIKFIKQKVRDLVQENYD